MSAEERSLAVHDLRSGQHVSKTFVSDIGATEVESDSSITLEITAETSYVYGRGDGFWDDP